MYEVAIRAPREHFLDFDKPLSEQSPYVRAAIEKVMPGVEQSQFLSSKGEHLYGGIGPTQRESSRVLSEVGVPGIKYLDQGSRRGGAGTSNFVIFDPKHVDILRKFALGGATLGPAGSLLLPTEHDPFAEGTQR